MKKYLFSFLVLLLMAMCVPTKALTTLNLTPTSKPLNSAMLTFYAYKGCSSVRQYYSFRSYLEKLETSGGGVLNVTKGTYFIPNTLFVPSNVTINFADGVVIKKTNTTCYYPDKYGVKRSMPPSSSLFQFIRPSRSAKTGVYGLYNGEKNIKFIGTGNVDIDLGFNLNNIAIIMGHNSNVLIKNIDFMNMKSGHFIEMDASYNVTIQGNYFSTAIPYSNYEKEAINLDTPDKLTGGFSQKWSKFDKTPNKNVYIFANSFKDLDRAIGTHNYSQTSTGTNLYHTNIQIYNNSIDDTMADAIRVMNWKDSVIRDNKISNVRFVADKPLRGVLASGAYNLTIKNNSFINVQRAVQFMPWYDNYSTIYNGSNSQQNIADLSTNKISFYSNDNIRESFVRYNTIYKDFVNGTYKYSITKLN